MRDQDIPEFRRNADSVPLCHGVRLSAGKLRDSTLSAEHFDDLQGVHTQRMTNHLSFCKPALGAKFVGARATKDLSKLWHMKDAFIVEFGKRAKAAMLESGFTSAAHVARELHERDSRVRNWTNGGSVPDLRTAVKLASAFGVTLDWLATGATGGLVEGKRIRLTAKLHGLEIPAISAGEVEEAGVVRASAEAKPARASRRRGSERAIANQ